MKNAKLTKKFWDHFNKFCEEQDKKEAQAEIKATKQTKKPKRYINVSANKTATVYMLIVDNKIYVGCTQQTLEQRLKQHISKAASAVAYGKASKVQKAVAQATHIQIIEVANLYWKEAYALETNLIAQLLLTPNCLNSSK
jgi:predicted GIY-YIG superfamily endonuclease